jgi:hypothetical protein
MSDEKTKSTRDAIAKTAKMVERQTGLSNSDARAYVEKCRTEGDNKRNNRNR